MTESLVEFLRARLAEDEQAARKHDASTDDLTYELAARCETGYPCNPYLQISQARALAEVDAKRRIITEHTAVMPGWCTACDVPGDYRGNTVGCQTLRLLVLPYAGHPDYQPEWAPRA